MAQCIVTNMVLVDGQPHPSQLIVTLPQGMTSVDNEVHINKILKYADIDTTHVTHGFSFTIDDNDFTRIVNTMRIEPYLDRINKLNNELYPLTKDIFLVKAYKKMSFTTELHSVNKAICNDYELDDTCDPLIIKCLEKTYDICDNVSLEYSSSKYIEKVQKRMLTKLYELFINLSDNSTKLLTGKDLKDALFVSTEPNNTDTYSCHNVPIPLTDHPAAHYASLITM